MNFTDNHKEILNKHRHLYDSLTKVGFMRNIDRPVFNELQQVHNEAIGVQHFTHWCGECVADMVRIIYTQYDKDTITTPVSVDQKRKRHGK